MQAVWKLSLQNSFKNFRRGHDHLEKETEGPPSKRLKMNDSEADLLNIEEYKEACSELQSM